MLSEQHTHQVHCTRNLPMNPEKRNKIPPPISLRLTPEEREKLDHAAQGTSLSSYIRKCVFGKETSVRKARLRVPVKDQEALAKTLGLLGQSRIANNLNQLAKEANRGSLLLDAETTDKINEAYEHILSMRSELIRALGLIEDQGQ